VQNNKHKFAFDELSDRQLAASKAGKSEMADRLQAEVVTAEERWEVAVLCTCVE